MRENEPRTRRRSPVLTKALVVFVCLILTLPALVLLARGLEIGLDRYTRDLCCGGMATCPRPQLPLGRPPAREDEERRDRAPVALDRAGAGRNEVAMVVRRLGVFVVVAALVANVGSIAILRGRAIGRERLRQQPSGAWSRTAHDEISLGGACSFGECKHLRSAAPEPRQLPIVPPWEWTLREWTETVWPWM